MRECNAESMYGLRNIRILCVNAMLSPCDGLRNIRILCVNTMLSPCDGLRNIRSLCVNAMLKSNAGSNLGWVHLLASKENKSGPVMDTGNHKPS